MKRLPIIRRIRYFLVMYRINRHYDFWVGIMGRLPLNADRDYAEAVAPSVAVIAGSLAEISEAAQAYIARFNLGAGNFAPEAIRDDNGNGVARVSYNGKIWPVAA